MIERNGQRTAERTAGESHGGKLLFGAGLDPRECGSRGGKASALTRKLRAQKQLEEKIASTRNGAAIFGLYRTTLERQAALERERLRQDKVVCALMDEADREREEIEILRRQREAEHERFRRLVDERKALRDAVDADEAQLLDRLRALQDAGELEALLVALDLFDVIEDEDEDALPAA